MFIICNFNERRVGYEDAYSDFEMYSTFQEALDNLGNHNVLIRERSWTNFRLNNPEWAKEKKTKKYKVSIQEASDYVFYDFKKEKFLEWRYDTGNEEPNVMGSGSTYYRTKVTCDMEEAFKYYEDMRDYLTREVRVNGQYHTEYYDRDEKRFIEVR